MRRYYYTNVCQICIFFTFILFIYLFFFFGAGGEGSGGECTFFYAISVLKKIRKHNEQSQFYLKPRMEQKSEGEKI